MNPGKLNRRLVLERRTVTKDAANGDVVTWAKVCNLWAELITQRGSEGTVADAERAQSSRQFRIRYRRDLNSTDFCITYQGESFDIRGISPEGLQQSLVLDLVSIQAIA